MPNCRGLAAVAGCARETVLRVAAEPATVHLPRDVFFFFGLIAFPFAAVCFCFFFAGTLTLPCLVS
jgi:hypothetical protein